ncbi:MAG: hypothetical protein OJF60_000623 [Burkholderiaceae bacterium]|nr:MAG: hypothetical protein OJF60_000623 [Burkholderiaceae bacterium]
MSNRRVFLMTVAAGTTALAATQRMAFAAEPELTSSDPQAAALGYVPDTTKADQKKYPNHTTAQHCSDCALHTPIAGSQMSHCSLFPGKLVHNNGWCSAWAKKA